MYRLFKLAIIVLIPLTIFLVAFLRSKDLEESLLNSDIYNVEFYCDEDEGGGSSVKGEPLSSGGYSMIYTLREGYEYPYALLLLTKKNSTPFSFSKRDRLELKLKSSRSRTLHLTAHVFMEGFSKIGDNSTFIPLLYKLDVSENFKEYSLDINDSYIPGWWLEMHNSDPSLIKYNFKNIRYFTLMNSPARGLNDEDRIEVDSFTVKKDQSKTLLLLLVILGAYYTLLAILYLITKGIKLFKKERTIAYESLKIENDSKEFKTIVEYIGLNFHNDQLSLTMISDNLGISVKAVSTFINRTFNLTFPEYLNQIRVSEAKRLLLSSDSKVVDIALRVGFNSPGHFNRVFKVLESCTPTAYRKEQRCS